MCLYMSGALSIFKCCMSDNVSYGNLNTSILFASHEAGSTGALPLRDMPLQERVHCKTHQQTADCRARGVHKYIGDLSRTPVDEELVDFVTARIEHRDGKSRNAHERDLP